MTLARWVAFGQLAGMKVSISLLLSFSLSLARSLFLFYYYVTSSVNFFSFSSFSCEIPREVSRYMLKMLGNRKMHVRARISSLLLLFFSPLAGKFQFLEQVFTRVEAFARRSKSVRE